jgi:3-methyl-2-oxobutanoate hydroxymethyltransferase
VTARLDVTSLQRMKPAGRKVVGVVVYDYPMARAADRAGVDLISVGDSVGTAVWGFSADEEVSLEQMLLVCRAVSRGASHALVSCDFPYEVSTSGPDVAVRAARRLVDEAGAGMVKVDAAAEMPEIVEAITGAGIPVWAQFGITPHSQDARTIRERGESVADFMAANAPRFVEQAQRLERAGAAMLDFTNSGPVAGAAVAGSVAIPVIGGLGGGPWLDGRVRALANAVGYSAAALDDSTQRYANVARATLEAFTAYADDVRAGRQVLGEPSTQARPPATPHETGR